MDSRISLELHKWFMLRRNKKIEELNEENQKLRETLCKVITLIESENNQVRERIKALNITLEK